MYVTERYFMTQKIIHKKLDCVMRYNQQQSHEARRTDILLSFYQNFVKFNPQYKQLQNWWHKNVLEVYTLQLQNV